MFEVTRRVVWSLGLLSFQPVPDDNRSSGREGDGQVEGGRRKEGKSKRIDPKFSVRYDEVSARALQKSWGKNARRDGSSDVSYKQSVTALT